MKLHCKCGACLTKELNKVKHKDAYDEKIIKEIAYGWTEDNQLDESNPIEYDKKEYSIKQGAYHKWKRKGKYSTRFGNKNVYVLTIKDLLSEEMLVNKCQGCCNWDYFEVQCLSCGEIVGTGGNDCWQEAKAMIVCTKVKVK